MPNLADHARHIELGQFLRSRRVRLRPEDFGITTGRRRTPGLRREEIADAAGISTTWYVWLEQGRDVKPSPHVLRALGKALRLSKSEQAYLFQLARPDFDWRNHLGQQDLPGAALLALLDGLEPHPAYILNRYWQVLAANRPAQIVLGDFAITNEWSGSLLARLFLDTAWRERFADWQSVARSAVAQFRLATVAMADDPVLTSLVRLLETASDDFRAEWRGRELAEPPISRKTIRHPVGGDLNFRFATLRPGGSDSDFTLSVYTPEDSLTAQQVIDLLARHAANPTMV